MLFLVGMEDVEALVTSYPFSACQRLEGWIEAGVDCDLCLLSVDVMMEPLRRIFSVTLLACGDVHGPSGPPCQMMPCENDQTLPMTWTLYTHRRQ